MGTVSAMGEDSDTLTSSFTAGNGDRKFSTEGNIGAVTVAGVLDHETDSSHTLAVQTDDGTATAAVNISVTDVAEDPDETRWGVLGGQSPSKGCQFLYDNSLDRANGDGVDYYTFTTDGRCTRRLDARDQSIELKVVLEDSNSNVAGTASPPAHPNRDQDYIEWLKITIEAGTYYVRVEALQEGATGYYIRFG